MIQQMTLAAGCEIGPYDDWSIPPEPQAILAQRELYRKLAALPVPSYGEDSTFVVVPKRQQQMEAERRLALLDPLCRVLEAGLRALEVAE